MPVPNLLPAPISTEQLAATALADPTRFKTTLCPNFTTQVRPATLTLTLAPTLTLTLSPALTLTLTPTLTLTLTLALTLARRCPWARHSTASSSSAAVAYPYSNPG